MDYVLDKNPLLFIYRYTIVESIDGQYGVDESSGMIGMLARGEIDIAIADFNPSATRWGLEKKVADLESARNYEYAL